MTAANRPPAATTGPGARRATWHRRAGLLPLVHLAGIVAIGLAHPVLTQWRWLAIHLLLLGAVSNAILIWSAHFTAAVLRVPAAGRRGQATRLALLNGGACALLVAGALELPPVGLAGAAAVFAAIGGHLYWLRRQLRVALPNRFGITVHYYVAASVALLTGIPVGAWMLMTDDTSRSRLLLFHVHVNLFGWVTLTVLGTVVTLWPTILRTRVAEGAVRAARTALPTAVTGLAAVAVGVLAWWPVLAVAGLTVLVVGMLIVLRPMLQTAKGKPPTSFAAWSIAVGAGWLLVAVGVDAAALAGAGDPDQAVAAFDRVLVPLLVGFVAQTLLGALSYLLPVVLGGGPAQVRAATSVTERHWPQRVVAANLALVVFLLPVPPYVRIATSVLVLAALVRFLVPAARLVLVRRATMSAPPPAPPPAPQPAHPSAHPSAPQPAPARPLGGVAVGIGLVLLAVVVGAAAQHVAEPSGAAVAPAAQVLPTGRTTTVVVTTEGMRFRPDRITVPAGDRLVIELTNQDSRRHDLVLTTGARTDRIGRDATARLDAGVITGAVEGWCSLPGHRQAGMTLTITTSGGTAAGTDGVTSDTAADRASDTAEGSASGHGHADAPAPGGDPRVDAMADPGPGFAAHDATAPALGRGRLHRIELRVQEVVREVAVGVRQKLWTFNGTAPGPVLRGRVGDTFEVTLVNDGSIDHGIDFHASALAPDGPMRPIDPGQRLTYRFTATKAGIWMYHCSTMPMLHHVGNGMYGAVIIDPPDLSPVDREYVLVQSELYLGPDGQPGDLAKMQAEQPDAVVFNGYPNQYAHQPLPATAGRRVRIWVLDAGPNRSSAFHIVGAQFDTVYREGRYLMRAGEPGGAQVLDLPPAGGGFVETVFPEPGQYPFVSHVMVDAERGARGTVTVEESGS